MAKKQKPKQPQPIESGSYTFEVCVRFKMEHAFSEHDLCGSDHEFEPSESAVSLLEIELQNLLFENGMVAEVHVSPDTNFIGWLPNPRPKKRRPPKSAKNEPTH
jgi:hypothetical protein